MKLNIFLLLALFFGNTTMFASPVKNSVGELKAENDLAERIEKNLGVLIEKSIVFVDLDLKYNMFNPSTGDLKFDQRLSLPGLPVGKTESSVPNIDLSDYAPTEITKLNITVRVPQDTPEDLLKEIEELVIKTTSIDILGNDQLLITADLPTTKSANSIFNFRNLVLSLFLFLVMIIIINIKNSTKIIAKSLRRIKISNLDQLAGKDKKDFSSFSSNTSSDHHPVGYDPTKPFQVKLIKDDAKLEDTNLDFLNDLSNSNFLAIVKEEDPTEIAIILTQVNPEKVDYFFSFYDGSIDDVINHLLKTENILQLDMKIMVVGMYQKYLEALEKNPLTINNIKTMVNFINKSSLSVAQDLFDRLKVLNPDVAQEVEKKIFLLNDILKLKNVQIEQINSEFTHLEMVQFLKCIHNEIKQKFFTQLSERAVIILKEDMEIIGEISKEESKIIINHSLNKIRYILNY